MRREERIRLFVREIWRWYGVNKRSLPWRDLGIADDAERAYRILVSEIMLQQTQVQRVIVSYRRFLEQFPSLTDLALASNRDILLAWRGMGYNARALRLRDAAREIVSRSKTKNDQIRNDCTECIGVFPRCMRCLLSIKGVGRYTAAAIRNFAFGLPTPCLDTNIRRILHRTFVGPEHPDGTWEKDDRYLLKLAEEILPIAVQAFSSHVECRQMSERAGLVGPAREDSVKGERAREREPSRFSFAPSEWHAALMDFGSLVCTKRNPRFELCPLMALGITKTTPISWSRMRARIPNSHSRIPNREPGRLVGQKFVPNRIFRGRVIEELRDAPGGLEIEEIGRRISVDWSPAVHRKWLRGILEKLKREALLDRRKKRYVLME